VRAVVQRVSRAAVTVDGRCVGQIGRGILLLVGIGQGDTRDDAEYILNKTLELRIFNDLSDKMNLSIQESGGSLLIVSQFTLWGDCRKGRRPSYSDAMEPRAAAQLYDELIRLARQRPVPVATGEFQAMMDVELVNDGPVTLLLDSRKQF
jgi:D-tyrosyl-tRNA(Tyr) deacylase